MEVPPHPLIYEINTWAWLTALSRHYGRPITLASIPPEEYDALAGWGFNAIWLMGVWERSPAARELAQRPRVQAEYLPALPDLTSEDVVGSAYAIHRYMVDAYLGGPDGLAACRAELARRGLALLLDYVPNHVAVDHPWLTTHPDAVVQGDAAALARDPVTFFAGPLPGSVIAHGRDPYFPAWVDTAQLNVFAPTARQLARQTLEDIAHQCDGVRCDMAMLLLRRIFATTWRGFVGAPPEQEFWREIIPPIKAAHPGFVFLAEVYWGTEPELQALGFDATYDKELYDRLREGNVAQVRLALSRPSQVLARMVHFVENHDEERALVAFGPQRSLAAATITTLAPGIRLLHEGQLAGWRIKVPVQLGRRLSEATDLLIQPFYRVLLSEARQPIYHLGTFHLLPALSSEERGLAFCWKLGNDWRLVVVNLTDRPLSGLLPFADVLPQADLLPVREVFSGATQTLAGGMLKVELPVYGTHIWRPR